MIIPDQSARATRSSIRQFFASRIHWGIYLVIALALLPGRFDWSSATRSPSWRGFLCSAYFICILIPLTTGLLDRYGVSITARNIALCVTTFVLALPYRWLRLDRWALERNRPNFLPWQAGGQPKLVWFPAAFKQPSQIPFEFLFFAFLMASLFCGLWLFARARLRAGRPLSRSHIAFCAGTILLILVETWMHLSLRSPYTYICHYERAPSQNYWYQVLLFRTGQGAVNADYFVFRYLEEVFMGTPHGLNGQLIRRPFPFYLSSQLSYFVNPYYVMVFFNVVIWTASVLAIRDYLKTHFDERVATVAGLLTASGPGFIMYVAQPQTYLWGYCAVALIIWAHWRMCMRASATLRDYILFGGLFSLALLTYDLLVLLFYLGGYHLIFKKSLRGLLISAGIAIAFYVGFGLLTAPMTSFVHDTTNTVYISRSLTSVIALVRSNPLAVKTYQLYTGFLPNYFWNLGNSVFVFPLFVAIVGLFWIGAPQKLKLSGLLLLPSLGGVAFLYFGQTYLSTLPRFAFLAYPAVYMLCSVALVSLAQAIGTRWKHASTAIIACGIVAHIVWVNADVFGHPWLYFLFYYQNYFNAAYF